MQDDSKSIKIIKLNEIHEEHIEKFTCLDENEEFIGFKSKKKKKFKKHSKEIDEFFKKEALKEQAKFLNTTHLFFIDGKLAGFISLCADSIRLDLSEKESEKVPYLNIPSLKIARLAIDIKHQKMGVGTLLINFAVKTVFELRDSLGIKFLTVDCYEHRISYYENLGFQENKVQRENRQSDSPISLRLNVDEYLSNLNI
ncbi:GNAT family N-acetyltransferase [Clostridium sardiniense]|uniref:GNAT family N-acetyltransferase n=1 Tax=Clostridium sardiniense TaxID=29369 RepID=UPI001956E152|nr:GNAT family N-acetyltransferase [Clostridium sardiniense]MBM7835731.1 GNAT superfamily N-acetyltransferase [Clostridium sardiniense]